MNRQQAFLKNDQQSIHFCECVSTHSKHDSDAVVSSFQTISNMFYEMC